MKINKLILLLFLITFFGLTFGQTVNILVSDPLGGYPEIPVVNSSYTGAGFTTVNITQDTISASVDTSTYDIVIIDESYTISGGGQTFFLSSTQRQIVEDFIQDGGHVIWIAENWDTYPIIGGIAPLNSNGINTINAIYGTNLSYGSYFDGGGMGSPNLPRIHPSNGPGGLSSTVNILSSGSYATLLNVPPLNAIYTSGPFANFINFDICTHTTIGLFPSQPTSSEGSVLISTEIAIPFAGITSGFGGPTIYNTSFDSAVAAMHFNLITGVSMTATNNWSDTIANTNTSCIPLEAIIAPSVDTICLGETITFTDSSTGNPTTWNWTFTNGTPATAATQGPHIVGFTSVGTHNITLQVGDGTDTDDTTIQVVVLDTLSINEAHTNPNSCTTDDGEIILSGFSASTTYNLNYSLNGTVQGPVSISSDATGNITINGLAAGDYHDFSLISSSTNSGGNVVINPSFEQVNSCLTGIGLPLGFGISNATGWSNANQGSADAFHLCNTGNFGSQSTPSNFQGNQAPLVGNGYAGVITFENLGVDFKEYIQSTLTSTLTAGQTYNIGFYSSLSDESQLASDGLAMHIGIGAVNQANQTTINLTPQLSSGMNTDAANWTLTQGTFTASGGENNVILGNFFTNANTSTLPTGFGTFDRANYYIDSVFIIPINSTLTCANFNFDTISLINIYPTVDAGNDTTICNGDNITLTAANPDGASISWDNAVTDGASFVPAATTTYTVTADLNGCTATDSIEVTVQNCSVLEAIFSTSIDTICLGESITFTDASTGPPTTWNWSFTNGTPATAATQGTHTVAFNTVGMHNITLQVGDGTNTDDTIIQVYVNMIPTLDAGTDTTICNGENITLTAVNPDGATISWDNAVTDGASFAPAATTTYTVTADLNGCIATDSIEVTVQNCGILEAIFNTSVDTVCLGDSITFTDASTGPPTTWNWTFTNGTPATAATQGSHTVAFNTVGTHNITLQVGDGTNTDDTIIQVYVNMIPTVDAGTDTTICNGENITLTAVNPDGATISWDNAVTDGASFAPATTTTYTVTADLNGCTSTDDIIVTVNPNDTNTVNASICAGDNYVLPDGSSVSASGTYFSSLTNSNGCDSTIITVLTEFGTSSFDSLVDVSLCSSFNLTLDANTMNMTSVEWFVDEGSGFVSLIGNPAYAGADTDELIVSLNTTLHGNRYRIVMQTACGGTNVSEMTLSVFTPLPVSNPQDDLRFCEHEPEILHVDYDGHTFEWNTGDFGSSIAPKESGTYTVNFIENGTNCRLSDDIEVLIEDCIANCTVGIATGFSPNGDGVNDKLKGLSTCNDGFKEFEFILANRWGEIIFKSTDPDFEWDGVYKNKTIEIGVYSYSIVYVKNFSEIIINDKGTVTVIK